MTLLKMSTYCCICHCKQEEKYIYIGHTSNIKRRLREHNLGRTPSNKSFAPFELIYKKCFSARQEAITEERELKKGHKREQLREMAYD